MVPVGPGPALHLVPVGHGPAQTGPCGSWGLLPVQASQTVQEPPAAHPRARCGARVTTRCCVLSRPEGERVSPRRWACPVISGAARLAVERGAAAPGAPDPSHTLGGGCSLRAGRLPSSPPRSQVLSPFPAAAFQGGGLSRCFWGGPHRTPSARPQGGEDGAARGHQARGGPAGAGAAESQAGGERASFLPCVEGRGRGAPGTMAWGSGTQPQDPPSEGLCFLPARIKCCREPGALRAAAGRGGDVL